MWFTRFPDGISGENCTELIITDLGEAVNLNLNLNLNLYLNLNLNLCMPANECS